MSSHSLKLFASCHHMDNLISELVQYPRGSAFSCTNNSFFIGPPPQGGGRSTEPPPIPVLPDDLPPFLKDLYTSLRTDEELYVNNYILLAPSETITRAINGFYDFALTYAGMGHVTVWSANHVGVHQRLDGGANGWDREENARRASSEPRVILTGVESVLRMFVAAPTTTSLRCQVRSCRHPNTHVTSGHKCGSCGTWGHGVRECGNSSWIRRLERFKNDVVDDECTIPGCNFRRFHTTTGHYCNICRTFGHGDEHHASVSVACPSCRQSQPKSSWIASFVDAECPICFEKRSIAISTVCRHGFCTDCIERLA